MSVEYYTVDECKDCKYGKSLPQGPFCLLLGRFLSEYKEYGDPCNKFSALTSRRSQRPEAQVS
ncbi:unnamed protein product [marine sediment metagenome]|uniref:Uncharacterized protein n=1 Tax=marine sediment metagenome TaxID=412755 RepID=X1E068_9ZZZZ